MSSLSPEGTPTGLPRFYQILERLTEETEGVDQKCKEGQGKD
jgi:hypothetical protein